MGLGVLFRTFNRLLADRRGGTSIVLTLMIVPIIGAVGMGVEGASWYLIHRAAQNAADAAAVAAAINACAPTDACDVTELSATYVEEAAAVAGRFGFVDNDSTDIATTMVNCPGTTDPDCYQVLITKRFPVSLVRLVGFNGDTTVGGQPAQTIRAVAIARPKGPPKGFCMIGLSETGTALTLNGLPEGNFNGCDLRSNSRLRCNGANSDTGVDYGYAADTSTCGDTPVPNAGVLEDPYDYLKDLVPAEGGACSGGYPGGAISSSSAWGSAVVDGVTVPVLKVCGNATLGDNLNITTANSVIVVYNGKLDLAGNTLSTSGSGSLTIILSGDNSATSAHHTLDSSATGGVLTAAAPSTGPFHGVVLMQDKNIDPDANHDLDVTYNGNNPELNIQGLIYLPKATLTVTGAINHFSNALTCVGVVANEITVSGTGAIVDNATSDCLNAGLTLPTIPGTEPRQALVQ